MADYDFKKIEEHWQNEWRKNKIYKVTEDVSKPKCYVLDMFPYPSGAGLHVGHPLGYIASDIYARYKRLKGFNVLHPMGYDAFGLPAEQYAIQTGQHPAITTEQNLKRYREQLDKIGFCYDWDREVRTSDPNYYKWTQWIFIKLFHSWYNPKTDKAESIETLIEKFQISDFRFQIDGDEKKFDELTEKEQSEVLMEYRLAYLAESYVNWCPQLGTVLANDEVKDGVSERGGYPVERKLMMQWSLRITSYADRLLEGLDRIDWTESLKETQRNWIGKSEGCSISFSIFNSPFSIEVFTTRPDTIFGVSFVTLAPEHELVLQITTPDRKKAVDEYVTISKNRSERERMADVKKISGEFTGAYVLHPFTGKQIPIWVGDYVLAGYGTGAVMAVPAHDSRDYAFAKHFNLEIIRVVQPDDNNSFPLGEGWDGAFDEKIGGKNINSDFLNGLETKAAIKKAIEEIELKGLGKGKTNYRLRDAIFGRQRYWGEPIPIYYDNGIAKTVDEKDLPILLPEVDKYLPTETGEPPLARATNWKYRKPLSSSPQGERTSPSYQTAAPSMWDSLKTNAKENRKNPTEAENVLWQQLKGENLGAKFRRQHAIGFYIADFVCLEKMLVIEVDGKYHEHQIVDDQLRANDIINEGFEIIRFTNDEVLFDIDEVIKKIKAQLESSSRKTTQVLPHGEDLGGAYNFELSTMPGWAGSSWYFLRYMDPENEHEFAAKNKVDYWQQIDLYLGGSEHATGHLLYFRFWTKFLYDLGLIPFDEPAKKLINQGMIQGVSSFKYQLKFLDVFGKPKTNPVTLFLSKGWADKVLKGFMPYDLNEVIIQQLGKSISEKIGIEKELGMLVLTSHVDINYVKTNELDIDMFKKSSDEYLNAEFILEDGKYICGSEVEKMSKSKYNVVTPDLIIEEYGADTLRLYEMFLGPLEQSKPWSTQGIEGVPRFLRKLWKLFFVEGNLIITDDEPNKKELKSIHKLIKKVGEDVEGFSFNTSVSSFMICVNEFTDLKCNKKKILSDYLICLSPYAPHIAEELWNALGNNSSIVTAKFPEFKPEFLIEDSFSYPISINGKHRTNIEMGMEMQQSEVEQLVMSDEIVLKWLEGKQPKKIVFVKGRIVNVVV